METSTKRGSFTNGLGFVLAAAGSAVGLGNLWRFPYLAAKDGGGLFLVVYLVLAVTFGFALMTAEVSLGRHTQKSPVMAFTEVAGKKWSFVGWGATLIPAIILPYYAVIGGWVCKYTYIYFTGQGNAAADGGKLFFYNQIGLFLDSAENPITSIISWSPFVWFFIFILATFIIVYFGVEKGIEKASRVLMPALLIIIIFIAGFSLFMKDEESGRTALDGLKIYVIPSLDGITVTKFLSIVLDAMSQLFYSLSLAMGIMITYGSYMKKEDSLPKSINQIEAFDTGIAFLAGLIMVPTVYCFLGEEGLANSGTGLMFVALPKVFQGMGAVGNVIGALFFVLVIFAALTSCVSIMEAVTSTLMDRFHLTRKVAVCITFAEAFILGAVVCLGYNVLFFSATFANVSGGQILDVFDWITNSFLMPIVAILTCIVVGYVWGTDKALKEVSLNGEKFSRGKLFVVMTKYVSPVLLAVILLNSFGIFG